MRLKALGYALIYIVLAGLRILFSGAALEMIVSNAAVRDQIKIYKGLFFVLFTGLALYVILWTWQREMSEQNAVFSSDGELDSVKKKFPYPLFIYWLCS